MTLSPLSNDLDIIAKLDDEPNDVGGMTPSELKSQFDLAGNLIKAYLNGTLIPALQTIADTADGLDGVFTGITAVQNTLASSTTEIPSAKAVADAIQAAGGGDMMQATYDTDGDGKVNAAVSADKATKLNTARTIALSGGATGSVSFNGTANVTIPVADLDPTMLKASVPINKGGTGATTAAAGLYALINGLNSITPASTDRVPFADVSGSTAGYMTLANLLAALAAIGAYTYGGTDVAVADGGTGASTAADARTNLGITPANIGAAESSHEHSASDITSGKIPISRGGTNSTTASAARTALGITPANIGAIPTGTVLWTNDSPTADFGAQTLNLSSLSSYNLFLIVCRRSENAAVYISEFAYVDGNDAVVFTISEGVLESDSNVIRTRTATIDRPNNTITFTGGNLTGGTYYPAKIMIPQKIIGFAV